MDKAQQDALKKAAGIEAAKLIEDGMIAGLGTGSTVKFLVDELGRRHQEEGLEFTGVTTSRRTQAQAESYGIKIVDIDDVDHIDVTIDGADEVDKNFNGIKGGGAALLWEEDRGHQLQPDRVDRGRIQGGGHHRQVPAAGRGHPVRRRPCDQEVRGARLQAGAAS